MKATRNTSLFIKAAFVGLALSGSSLAQANDVPQFDPNLTRTCAWDANAGSSGMYVEDASGPFACGYFVFSSEELVKLTKRVLWTDIEVNCNLNVGGWVIDDSAAHELVIQVVAVDADPGDNLCGAVSFPGTYPTSATVTDPWTARVSHASLPASATDDTLVSGTFTNVNVATSFLGTCAGSVAVTFQNTTTNGVDEPSLFDFSGSTFGGCTVTGSVKATDGHDFNHDGVISAGPYETSDSAGAPHHGDIDVWH